MSLDIQRFHEVSSVYNQLNAIRSARFHTATLSVQHMGNDNSCPFGIVSKHVWVNSVFGIDLFFAYSVLRSDTPVFGNHLMSGFIEGG